MPLPIMASGATFVFAIPVNALEYAFFKDYAQIVRTRTQSSLADRKLTCHLAVLLDLRVPLVQMVVENKFLFVFGQELQALCQTLGHLASLGFSSQAVRHDVGRNFLPPSLLQNHVAGHTVKVPGRIADVSASDLVQSSHHAIHCLVSSMSSITDALGHKHPHESGVDRLVPLASLLAIGIQPLK